MKKIMIIDSSDLLRQYLKDKLEQYGFDVITSKDGFEGSIKIKNELPDLIIMDYFLNRVTGLELLKEKSTNVNAANIPVIILSTKIDRELIGTIARYKIYKFLAKPIKIDLLIQSLSELFNVKLEIDNTPCILDVHLNDDILFTEAAQGLNREKIGILKYKIMQIKEIHNKDIKKGLLILSDIEFNETVGIQLSFLLDIIFKTTSINESAFKVLTNSPEIKTFFNTHEKYKKISVLNDFVSAIESFGKIDLFAYGDEIDNIKKDMLTLKEPVKTDESIVLKFDSDNVDNYINIEKKDENKYSIALIDDDFYILELIATVLSSHAKYDIKTYENGKFFVQDLEKGLPDLIFLDLMMPEMGGFEIIKHLRDKKLDIPIIIVTAMSNKDTIITAQKLGIKSFITKPIKIDILIKKTDEILKADF